MSLIDDDLNGNDVAHNIVPHLDNHGILAPENSHMGFDFNEVTGFELPRLPTVFVSPHKASKKVISMNN